MSQKQAAVLAGLAIAVVSITACHKNEEFLPGAGHHYGQKPAREFRVYIYSDGQYPNSCFADWPVATLWKSSNQTVTWVSDDSNKYTVDFSKGHNGSPFPSKTFDIPAGQETSSGGLNSSASGYYDFAILAGNGQTCKDAADPGYYVK